MRAMSVRNCLLLIFLFVVEEAATGQYKMKEYVQGNTVWLSTIDPDSADDSGLEAIGKAIGDARVVMLGEQDHGDAPTYLAKTRIIKYLHEKMGFNVLAFESDFFALNQGWERLPKTAPAIDSFIRADIFPIWTECNTCRELFYSYIPGTYKTDTPLELAGVDNQLILRYSVGHLAGWLDSVMRDLRLPIVTAPGYSSEILPMIDSARWWDNGDSMAMVKRGLWLDTMSAQAARVLKPEDFRMMVIRNLIALSKEYGGLGSDDRMMVNSARDLQMGRNLRWLADTRYPGQKIIVWAANWHIARIAGNFPHWTQTLPTMGGEFERDSAHRREVYTIGFTSIEGKAGRLGAQAYTVPGPGFLSFERWLWHDLDYGFVDFRPYNHQHPRDAAAFPLSAFGHHPYWAVWNRVFDGVICIRKMYPCTR
jgi:erythromycin esterase